LAGNNEENKNSEERRKSKRKEQDEKRTTIEKETKYRKWGREREDMERQGYDELFTRVQRDDRE